MLEEVLTQAQQIGMISEDFDESSYPDVVTAVSQVDICGPRGYTVPGTSSKAQSFDISSFTPGRFIDLQDSDIISRDGHNFADASSAEINSPGRYNIDPITSKRLHS